MLPLIMAAAGLAKSELVDRPRADRQRQANAEMIRWSPWTGLKPTGEDVAAAQEPDSLGNAFQFGMAGLGTQQSMDNVKQQQGFNESLKKNMEAQTAWYNKSASTPAAAPAPVTAGALPATQGIGPVSSGNLYAASLNRKPAQSQWETEAPFSNPGQPVDFNAWLAGYR